MAQAPGIIAFTSHSEDLEFIKVAAATAELECVFVQNLSEVIDLLQTHIGESIPVLIEANNQEQYSKIEAEFQEKLGLFSEELNPNMIVFITENKDISELRFLLKSPIFGTLITRSYGNAQESGKHFGWFLKGLKQPKAFGLKNFLAPQSKLQVIRFGNTKQKLDACEAIKNYAVSAQFKSRMASMVATACDELLMNAMFDAPIDETGNQMYSMLPRDTELELLGKDAVEMFIGFDGLYLGVAVGDHHGSLDKERLLDHLARDFSNTDYKVKASSASAGVGLAQLFNRGVNLVFVSDRNQKTEVTAMFKKTDSYKDFKSEFRLLSVHVYGS